MTEWEDDETLAARCGQENDLRALEILFQRHVSGCYSFAQRFLACREDAEEAVSETWLRAGRALRGGRFRNQSLFRTWLLGITKHVCQERLRQPRLPTLSLSEILESGRREEGLFTAPPAPPSPLDQALSELSEEHRLVLSLCELQGLTDEEAAPLLNRSPSAAKSLRFRARRALRDTLIQQENLE